MRTTVKKIPPLKEGEIYVALIHDQEYGFNEFRAVFTDLDNYLESLLRRHKTALKFSFELSTEEIPGELTFPLDYMIYAHFKSHTCPIGRILIVQINPKDFESC